MGRPAQGQDLLRACQAPRQARVLLSWNWTLCRWWPEPALREQRRAPEEPGCEDQPRDRWWGAVHRQRHPSGLEWHAHRHPGGRVEPHLRRFWLGRRLLPVHQARLPRALLLLQSGRRGPRDRCQAGGLSLVEPLRLLPPGALHRGGLRAGGGRDPREDRQRPDGRSA